MNSILRTIIVLTFFCLIFTNCRPRSLDIDIPQVEKKIVISSMNPTDNIFLIFATYSYSALSGDTNSITNFNSFLLKNADVSISHLGQIDTLEMLVPGVYIGWDISTKYDIKYKLNVNDPTTGESITAETKFNKRVSFDSIDLIQEKKDTNSYKISYNFKDIEPDKDNWYMLDFINIENYLNILKDTSLIGSVNSIKDFFNTDKLILVDGSRFKNGLIKESLTVKKGFFEKGNSYLVAISSISRGYFDYLHAKERAGNVLSSFVSEPVSYPSNIEGGYGYFTTNFISFDIVTAK